MISRPNLLLATLLLAACGSTAIPPAASDGGVEGGSTLPDGPTPADGPAAKDGPVAVDLAGGTEVAPADALPRDAAPPDAAPSGDAPRTSAVRFVLRNETGQTIYLQDNGFWTLWRGDESVHHHDSCEYCNCDDSGGCAVCGASAAVTLPIAPGATQTWEWMGLDWKLKPFMLGTSTLQCEAPEAVPPGPLQVRVVYSLSKDDRPVGSYLGEPLIILPLDFQHPPTGDVELVVR